MRQRCSKRAEQRAAVSCNVLPKNCVCAGLKRSSCGTANTDQNIMKSNILLCLYCVMLAAFSAELTNSTQSFLPKFPSFLSIGFMVL